MFERQTIRKKATAGAAPNGASELPVVYSKLEVGEVDSPFEREAEAVATQVMRKIDTGHRDLDTMSKMEHAFGADFSGVRLHTDGAAAQRSADLQARAYTHGNDIHFGRGEYDPNSRQGQHLLAHELTHTIQQTGATRHDDHDVARRSPLPNISRDTVGPVRRWALDKGVDLTETKTLTTVGTAQPTFIASDSNGERILLKPASVSLNLLQLADIVNPSVHGTSYVKTHAVDASQQGVLVTKISDPAVAKGPKWTETGKKQSGQPQQGEDTAGKARRLMAQAVSESTTPIVAQQVVDGGKNGKELSKEAGKGQNKDGSAMRDRLESPLFMRSAGHALATDAFTGNGDRLTGGNMGNFMSTGRDNFTMIDNMDKMMAGESFSAGQSGDWIPTDLIELAQDRHAKAEKTVKNLVKQFGYEGEDAAGLTAWLDEPGAHRKQFMVDDMVKGVDEAAESIVNHYATNKKKSTGRELKAAIKGIEADDDQIDYWEVLKARAQVLKNPGAADKMVKRLQKRHAAAQKKKTKKSRRKG